jgi:hypothetical protein
MFSTLGKVWGLESRRVYTQDNTLREPNASITVIVSASEDPIFLDYRIESNNQWDFLEV